MKKILLAAVALLVLWTGCSLDRTLDTLVPSNAMAVLVIDQPSLLTAALKGPGLSGDLPWKALDPNKPWAGAVLPASPPGFVLFLALADDPAALSQVEAWSKSRGGLVPTRIGSYVVLSSPGTPTPTVLPVERQFDLSKVRAGGDPIAVYLQTENFLASAGATAGLPAVALYSKWAAENVAGLRVGVSAKDGGLELRLATDLKPTSALLPVFKAAGASPDPSLWTGPFPLGDGLSVAASLDRPGWSALGPLLGEPALVKRWEALSPLLGPRWSFSVHGHADGTWSWSAAVESTDPHAIRQALKTLVAAGDVQRRFSAWDIDADTPLIYQDAPDGLGGIQTRMTLGSNVFYLGYGDDRIAISGGKGSTEALRIWSRASTRAASWVSQAPSSALLLATGSYDGLGAKAAARVLSDGNLELRVWVDAVGLKAWEERLPQALLGWLSGEGGWTRWEP